MTELEHIIEMLEELSKDRRVPRNIRAAIVNAIKELNKKEDEEKVRLNAAISILDEVSNDPNIKSYTRTEVWNIVSLMEELQAD